MQNSHSSKKALIVKTNIKLERTHLFQQTTQPKKTLPLHKYPSNNLFFNNQLDTTPKQTNYQNTKPKKIQLTTSNTNINLTGKSKFNNNNINSINSNTTKNNKKQTNKVIKFFSFNNKNNNNISIKNKNTLRVINFFSPIKKKNNIGNVTSKNKHVHYYHNALSPHGNMPSSPSYKRNNKISSPPSSSKKKITKRNNLDVLDEHNIAFLYQSNDINQQINKDILSYQGSQNKITTINNKYSSTTTNTNYSQTHLGTSCDNNNKLNSTTNSNVIQSSKIKKIDNNPSSKMIGVTTLSNSNTIKSYLYKTHHKHTASQRTNTLKYTLNNTNNIKTNIHSHSNSLLINTNLKNNTLTLGNLINPSKNNPCYRNIYKNENLSLSQNNLSNDIINSNSNQSNSIRHNNSNGNNKIQIKVNRKGQIDQLNYKPLIYRVNDNIHNNNIHIYNCIKTASRSVSKPNTISLNKHISSGSNKLPKKQTKNSAFVSPKQFLYSYHKYLTSNEIEEIKTMIPGNHLNTIFYYNHIQQRKKQKIYTNISINNSFCSIKQNNQQQKYNLNNKANNDNLNKSFDFPHVNIFDNKYDDNQGDYIIKSGDHLNYRYEIITLLGKGSYGEAVKCFDHKIKQFVCIKIIKSNPKFKSQAILEIELLEYLTNHDPENYSNIVKFYNHFSFRNHICLVFELLDMNLYEYLKLKHFNGFNEKRIREYTKNMLFCLLFLKKHKIIHCDLKPENILTLKNNKNSIKVIDFGSSCFDTEKMYSYIQSRFYRAPEIILEKGYSFPIDMWSLGCILCELYTGIPIFPGENERDLLNYIMEYIDIPSDDYINTSRRKKCFFDENNKPYQIPNSYGKIRIPNSKSFNSFMQGASKYFIDFIEKCLVWYPELRITPEDALMHNFIVNDMDHNMLYSHKQKIKKIQKEINHNKINVNVNMFGKCGNNMISKSYANTTTTTTLTITNKIEKHVRRNSYSYEKNKTMIFKKDLNRKQNFIQINNQNINNINYNIQSAPSIRTKEHNKY
jgi:dual specificity tyrosine-phosphorylation-regulated kinase 2/3/4